MGMPTIQQHVQAAQSMLQSGQLGGAGQGAPMGMMSNIPPGALQNLTPQQQQQMATAMGFFTQAAQAQGQSAQSGQTPQPQPGAQQVRPGMPPMQPSTPGRPPMGMANINTSDFPFDWRLLPQIPFLNDARWRNDMQNRNPQLLAATQNAHATIQAGGVRADVLARMQQLVQMAARSHVQGAVRQPGTPQGGQPGTPQAGMPGFANVPPGQAQRMYPGLGQGTPTTPQSARPPPPHLAPGGAESPSTATMPPSSRRTSAGTKSKAARESAPGQPNHAMPPPAWIPGHPAGPGAVRPPSEADGVHPPTPATIAGPTPVSASKAIPVKEWEAALRLDLPITTITPLPVTEVDEAQDPTFGGHLAALSEREKDDIKHWIEKDQAYASGIDDIKGRLKGKMVKWARGNDMETPWWSLRKGERYARPAGRLKIVWPADKASQRARTTHKGRREIRL
jgi:SWI/SNF-related matrix-associated actin-dependent regulator of chromatin subfamily B protein 1